VQLDGEERVVRLGRQLRGLVTGAEEHLAVDLSLPVVDRLQGVCRIGSLDKGA